MPDGPIGDSIVDAQVTQCSICGRFVCVDLMEAWEPFGSATTEPCRGKRR